MRYTISIILLCIVVLSCEQKSDQLSYRIYQFKKNDSLNGHISKIVSYNSDGLIAFEKQDDFISIKGWPTSDIETTHYYKDSLRVKTLKKYYDRLSIDSMRIEYIYNEKQQLIKRLNFEKYRPFKKDRTTSCLASEDDFEAEAIWKLSHTELFKYNEAGLKIERYIPEQKKFQNRFLFEYDNDGRIIKKSFLSEAELIEVVSYKYVDNGHTLISNSGRVGNDDYRFKKDEKGNSIEEQKKWDGKQIYRIERVYDDHDRVLVERGYNDKDELKITHKYSYE